MRRRKKRKLHLLEVGVRWPPESFVGWKLEGLAADGMRVTVATNRIFDPDACLRGVEFMAIPERPSTRASAVRAALPAGLALLATSPRRLMKLVRSVRQQMSAPAAERYGGTVGLLAMCLALARQRPDVVHFEWHRSAVHYLPLFDVWDCPVTTSFRGSDIRVYPHVPDEQLYASRLPEVLKRVSAVHCVADSLRRDAVAFGLDPAKAWVARPGVNPEVFKPPVGDRSNGAGPDGGLLRVAMVGWLRWEKGHEYALQAIRALLDRGVGVHLHIFGAVPAEKRRPMDERQRILHAVKDLGLEDCVRMSGHASSAQINRHLQASDVLLHPSLTEGIPAAIVEAMACEVPVVASDCGGVSEAVTDGVEGLLVAPRQPDQLTAALLRLWKDPGLRKRMGQAGRQRILSEFTLEHEHAVFRAMYRQAVGK